MKRKKRPCHLQLWPSLMAIGILVLGAVLKFWGYGRFDLTHIFDVLLIGLILLWMCEDKKSRRR